MKVDMSPRAVTERLKTMNELWLLSVKLMNSKKVKIEKDNKSQARRLVENLNSDAEKSRL